ncbi:MAG: DUF5916 domain-containing protein [Saprospiraceae bacterium]
MNNLSQIVLTFSFAISSTIAMPLWAQKAQEKLQDSYQLSIQRSNEKIVVDGILEEQVWQSNEKATNFWMSYPIDDKRAAEEIQTEVMVTYDDNFIYIAAICKGGGPYVIPSLKRDNPNFWQGDAFSVVLDPVNERSSGFSFGVNPAGVQTESLISGQTGRRGDQRPGQGPTGVNSAWDNKWFTNTKIYPDKWTLEMAIPFKSLRFGEKKTWGINFIRGHSKTNSFHTWSPVPVQFRGVDLGYTGALIWDNAPKKIKSNISFIPYALGGAFKDFEENLPVDKDFSFGADAKVAITSNLNLDVTINPDFSQVDVDEQVTNLTTVNVRFPERRLFFLENSDLFENVGIPPMRPFFSRRIGLDEDGNSIPISYGLRLSGNLNKDSRIGVMNIQTKEQEILPGQNYTSVAFQQRVLKRSTLKAYLHNRQAIEDGKFEFGDYNRTTGLEFEYQSLDGKWRSVGGYGLALSDGVKNDNYYYNSIISYDSRTISFYTNLAGVGNNYFSDMGFIPRFNHYDALRDTTIGIGFNHLFSRLGYTLYPKQTSNIISHQFYVRNNLDFANDNRFIEDKLETGYNLSMRNSSSFSVVFYHYESNLLFPFDFTESEPLPAGRYIYNFFGVKYQTDQRKLLSLQAGIEMGNFYNGERTEYSLNLKYRVQPWGNFGLNFVQNELKFPEPYGEESLFLVGPKLEFNFSRNLFWTTFLQYNTQEDNFNVNSRIQWRFQPMSDLFIVYSDNYALEFWGPKNRGLVIKLNYWLNI